MNARIAIWDFACEVPSRFKVHEDLNDVQVVTCVAKLAVHATHADHVYDIDIWQCSVWLVRPAEARLVVPVAAIGNAGVHDFFEL